MHVPDCPMPELMPLHLQFVYSASGGRIRGRNRDCSHGVVSPCEPEQRRQSAPAERGGNSICGFQGKA
jgi:hypothetical protein